MRRKSWVAPVAAVPVLVAGTALGGEGVQVNITNDGTEESVVTVYDMNTRPVRVVLNSTDSASPTCATEKCWP